MEAISRASALNFHGVKFHTLSRIPSIVQLYNKSIERGSFFFLVWFPIGKVHHTTFIIIILQPNNGNEISLKATSKGKRSSGFTTKTPDVGNQIANTSSIANTQVILSSGWKPGVFTLLSPLLNGLHGRLCSFSQ